jgi:general nucleoside transport system ATP-binding protein
VKPGPRIELRGVSRVFGALTAVRELSLALEPGRIHAIIGENGAGKSTAMKLAAGYLAPSRGEVLIDGEALAPASPLFAIRRGVGMVHQHFMLVDRMSALENLVLGHEPSSGPLGVLDLESARRAADEIASRTGLGLDLDRDAERLSVGERQRLEILRVLFRGARAILLDEPTAVLTPLEAEELYGTLRALAADGATVAVVTHRLDEVVRWADHVTVMRRGAGVLDEALGGRRDTATESDKLTRAIMGGEPPPVASPPELAAGAGAVLELHELAVARAGGGDALRGLSLSVRAGEIVGVAGVEGNGQRELVRALAGLAPLAAGHVTLAGARLAAAGDTTNEADRIARLRAAGLAVVHEDRHKDELMLAATIADNLVLGDLGSSVPEPELAKRRFARFDVYPADPARLAGELSGGNQQKVVMARALDRKIVALCVAQPTRGVDVGTARVIQRAIADTAGAGAAVIVVSADLHELKALAHRIVVLRKGRIVSEHAPDDSDESIGRAMLGATTKEAS